MGNNSELTLAQTILGKSWGDAGFSILLILIPVFSLIGLIVTH